MSDQPNDLPGARTPGAEPGRAPSLSYRHGLAVVRHVREAPPGTTYDARAGAYVAPGHRLPELRAWAAEHGIAEHGAGPDRLDAPLFDPREPRDYQRAALERWLATQLAGTSFELAPASEDASFRRYFRVSLAAPWPQAAGAPTLIAMDAPPDREDCRPFVDIAARLRAAGLNAPEVLAADLAQGFLLLTDLGRQTMLEAMTTANAGHFFDLAVTALVEMQRKVSTEGLPRYDRALLQRELALYPDWYLARHAGESLSAAEQQAWETACEVLVGSALNQPQVFVHRDFMPRNLMIATASTTMPGIIDFQDAVKGPICYDLLSLFKDAFGNWPDALIERGIALYREQAKSQGFPEPENFRRAFDLVGVQRHLKVIGIFARLHYRDGKARYLAETPRFHQYIYTVAGNYLELADLLEILRKYEVREIA